MAESDWLRVDRLEFRAGELLETTAHPDPIEQFRAWWEDLRRAGIKHPDQMTLATATRDGRPSARIVLLKAFDARGFVFVTNYTSRKGRELAENPRAALCFYWEPLERQVRVEGQIEKIGPEQSTEYFNSRPRGARIGAWASPQSQEIPGRAVLEDAVRELEQKYPGEPIPRPEHWGGYRLVPELVEFWQGRESRLHDRLLYRRQGIAGGDWTRSRLAP